MNLYSLYAFNWYQKHDHDRPCGLGDLSHGLIFLKKKIKKLVKISKTLKKLTKFTLENISYFSNCF